ncbi:hypothetical protein IMSAGC019_01988 [Lachnospiraceae bacterium]|nr:hypothetical protein IMSAGC019_01988 [Lachnospiraceae bacterium]
MWHVMLKSLVNSGDFLFLGGAERGGFEGMEVGWREF